MKIVVVSGGFDPVHSGHIAYFKSAKALGDMLIVALNSDEWLINKKKKFFMPFVERKIIIENLFMVDEVISFEDDEIGSCCLGLEKLKVRYPSDQIIFCNGGDRDKDNDKGCIYIYIYICISENFRQQTKTLRKLKA